jgi:hypothetical protein
MRALGELRVKENRSDFRGRDRSWIGRVEIMNRNVVVGYVSS